MNPFVLLFLILFGAAALCLLMREGLAKKPWQAMICAVLLALAFSLRASFFSQVTGDYETFLSMWVNFYREGGGFRAFGTLPPWCNYHVPYLYFLALFSYLPVDDLYLIKLLSVLFDLVLAWAAMKLVSRVTRNGLLRLGCFFMVLFWPTVVLNGSFWGQCDSIYTAFALLAVWLALDDRPKLSMVMWAMSFGFKLQSVFVLPLIAVLWIYGKYRWHHLLIFPLSYLLLILPGVLMGLPFWDTVTFYLSQTGSVGSGLNYNSSSIYAFFRRIPEEQQSSAALFGILAAGFFLLNLLAVAWLRRGRMTDRSVLCLALLMAVGIPFLLPHMHDRYFFAADVLALVLAFTMPPFFLTAPLVEFASILGYYAYLSGYVGQRQARYLLGMEYGALSLLAVLILTAFALVLSFSRGGKGPRSPALRKNRA